MKMHALKDAGRDARAPTFNFFIVIHEQMDCIDYDTVLFHFHANFSKILIFKNTMRTVDKAIRFMRKYFQ